MQSQDNFWIIKDDVVIGQLVAVPELLAPIHQEQPIGWNACPGLDLRFEILHRVAWQHTTEEEERALLPDGQIQEAIAGSDRVTDPATGPGHGAIHGKLVNKLN